MAAYPAVGSRRRARVPTVMLGHGASGSPASMAPWVDGLRAVGFEAGAVALPRGLAERAVPRFAAQTPDVPGVVVGGHSFGGRVATLLAAACAGAASAREADASEEDASEADANGTGAADADAYSGGRERQAVAPARRHPLAGVVALSFPLHAPGRADSWAARTAHWPGVRVPVLLLSGGADPFARIDLLREAVTRLPHAELVIYPGLGHGLAPVREDALERIAAFVRSVAG